MQKTLCLDCLKTSGPTAFVMAESKSGGGGATEVFGSSLVFFPSPGNASMQSAFIYAL